MDKILQVQNLGMHFGGIHAIEDLSFKVAKDSITAIIGPNGAGKTTLFNCITGFYKATSGNIVFTSDNKTINVGLTIGPRWQAKCWYSPTACAQTLYYKMFGGAYRLVRAGIARTFQNIRLFQEMSVVENLLIALHLELDRNLIAGLLNTNTYKSKLKDATEQAYYWLERLELSNYANRLAGELPYGAQRRLEIARALCTKPKLLCLDEPAAGLNPKETQALSEFIFELRQQEQITILLIEHDMSMVMQISDTVLALNFGALIAQGSPTAVKTDPEVIKAYLGS